jgi:hypothetical protein
MTIFKVSLYTRLNLAVLAAVFTAWSVGAQAQAGTAFLCNGVQTDRFANAQYGTANEKQIQFVVRLDPAAGKVVVAQVAGTTMIRPGNFVAARDGSAVRFQWSVVTPSGADAPVAMTIDADGNFNAEAAMGNPMDSIASTVPIFGDLVRIDHRISINGVCTSVPAAKRK